jgi:two-component system chemotaxis response regulator CheY
MATILIVDDYAPQHRLLGFVLEQHGHVAVSARDGIQALERLATTNIDLVVTDLTMPKMDGLALAREIRTDRRYGDMPIIILTASGKEQDQVRAAGIGIDCFLTKPIDSEELVEAVYQLMQKEGSGGQRRWPFLGCNPI